MTGRKFVISRPRINLPSDAPPFLLENFLPNFLFIIIFSFFCIIIFPPFLLFFDSPVRSFIRFNTPDIMRGSANVLFSFPWALPQHFARCFARVCVFHKIIFKLTFIYFPLFRKFPGNISFITDGIMKIVTGSFNMITLFWMCLKLNIFFLRFFFSFERELERKRIGKNNLAFVWLPRLFGIIIKLNYYLT